MLVMMRMMRSRGGRSEARRTRSLRFDPRWQHCVTKLARRRASTRWASPWSVLGGSSAAGIRRFQADPLFDEDTRPLLDPIESADAGKTWRALSLFGEVDFHSFQAAQDLVYGFDGTSSRFLVSNDGAQWETRSEGLAMSDLAVDTASPNHVVAMTDGGLAQSTHGCRSWDPIEGPALPFLSWRPDYGLWGVDGQGEAFTREASPWRPRGDRPGPPQALLVGDDTLCAAASEADETGIYESSDEDRSWQLRYADR